MAGALKMKVLLCAERQVHGVRSRGTPPSQTRAAVQRSQLAPANRGKTDFLIWSVSTTKKHRSSDCSKNILEKARFRRPWDSERSLIVLFYVISPDRVKKKTFTQACMVILPAPLCPPPPHVSVAAALRGGVRSRNCVFISVTSGSIFGFSSPAAAVGRHTSEQPNVGQLLPCLHWWLSPGLEGGVLQGLFLGGGGGGLGEGARPQPTLRLACLFRLALPAAGTAPWSPHSTAPGNSGMQTISRRKKPTGAPQFDYCPEWVTSAPPPCVSVPLHPRCPPASSRLRSPPHPPVPDFSCGLSCRF